MFTDCPLLAKWILGNCVLVLHSPLHPLLRRKGLQPARLGVQKGRLKGKNETRRLEGMRGRLGQSSGFPDCAVVKNLPASAGETRDAGSISGSEGSPGVGNGNPLPYSCLENPPWAEESDGLQSLDSQPIGHNWVIRHSTERTWAQRFSLKKLKFHGGWKVEFHVRIGGEREEARWVRRMMAWTDFKATTGRLKLLFPLPWPLGVRSNTNGQWFNQPCLYNKASIKPKVTGFGEFPGWWTRRSSILSSLGIWCWERLKAKGEGGSRRWNGLDSTTDSMDMNLSKLREMVDRRVWCAAVPGITKSQTQLSS